MKRMVLTMLVTGIVGLVLGAWLSGPTKRSLKRGLAWWNSRSRFAERVDQPPFAHLALSQVGYGSAMAKRFTAPQKFERFRVVSEADGTVAFEGGAAVQSIQTDILGPIRTVFVGDFSALNRTGRYRVVTDGGAASFPFDIRPDVFDAPVRAIQRWFYYQRAFTAIDRAHAEGPWVHPSDADKAPPGVRGGWHDAGDFSVYSISLNTAIFWMLETWSDFAPTADDTNIPESGNGVPDLLDEARWGIEWLLSVQDASGAFRNTTCQDRYRSYGRNTPDNVPPYKNGELGTFATARAAGNLAYAASIFRRYDPGFAERCLKAARTGYAWLKEHWTEDTDGTTCPTYNVDGNVELGRHVRMFAAAGMLLGTGEARFRDDFEDQYVELDYDPSYNHVNGFAAQIYLRSAAGDAERKRKIRERLRMHADRALADGDKHPFQLAARSHWGMIGAGFTRTGSYSVRMCLEDPARANRDCEQALANVHYLFGRNYMQMAFVSGLPGVTRGRQRAFHQWLAALRADPFCFPGMVAGGPNIYPERTDISIPDAWPIPIWGYWGDPAFPRSGSTPVEGRYTDNDSWSTNEISVDWQSSTLYGVHFARWMAKGRPPRSELSPSTHRE
ncbi:MAG TPA: glycoside hydrolase family 9 protein [Myxococcales bacterium]|nr:glycoside hydrolase family 9 protein [Myxococcales bacterium]